MTSVYVVTFFTHYEAMRFHRDCVKRGYQATLLPVPRKLSASCGTCVQVVCTAGVRLIKHVDMFEVEGVYLTEDGGQYRCIMDN